MSLWPIVIMGALIVGIFYVRMKARAEKDRRAPDAGLAILDFGRAFPEEPIRAIYATVDEKAYFVRLYDGKAGFMIAHGAHFVCHLIEAGKIRVAGAPSGHGLEIHFTDFSTLDAVYEFRTAEVAAEVSLWLLGSFSPQSEFKPAPAD